MNSPTPAPSTSQTSSPPPTSSGARRGRVDCAPFPGTRGWHSAPAPLSTAASRWEGRGRQRRRADPSQRGESLPRPGPFNRPRALCSHGHKARRAPPLQQEAPIPSHPHPRPSHYHRNPLPLHGAHPAVALSKALPSQMLTAAGSWRAAPAPPLRCIECSAALPRLATIAAWHCQREPRDFR